jgi:hypothetical protein
MNGAKRTFRRCCDFASFASAAGARVRSCQFAQRLEVRAETANSTALAPPCVTALIYRPTLARPIVSSGFALTSTSSLRGLDASAAPCGLASTGVRRRLARGLATAGALARAIGDRWLSSRPRIMSVIGCSRTEMTRNRRAGRISGGASSSRRAVGGGPVQRVCWRLPLGALRDGRRRSLGACGKHRIPIAHRTGMAKRRAGERERVCVWL